MTVSCKQALRRGTRCDKKLLKGQKRKLMVLSCRRDDVDDDVVSANIPCIQLEFTNVKTKNSSRTVEGPVHGFLILDFFYFDIQKIVS